MKRFNRYRGLVLSLLWTLVLAALGYCRGVGRAFRASYLSGAEKFWIVTHPKSALRLATLAPIGGADPLADQLADAGTEVRNAVEAMEAAFRELDTADEDADVEPLERAFTEAEDRHRSALLSLRRVESVVEARGNLPTPPVVDPDEPADERGEPARPKSGLRESDLTYQRSGEYSFFSDMYQSRMNGDRRAQDRLTAHMNEQEQIAADEGRALSTTAGAGGQFVPPTWMNDEWVRLARAGRPTANIVRHFDLPDGANSINIPRVATGAATAAQADNGSVQSTDPTTDSIAVPVRTVAGQVDTSRQLVDRAQPGIDQILFGDLHADYATKINVQVISGTGSGANATGILNTASIEAVTYTDASPTPAELYPKIADAVYNRVGTLRLMPAEAIVMHPRRWGWLLAAVDSSGRPLVVPNPNAGVVGFGAVAAVADGAQGGVDLSTNAPTVPVGFMLGLPVYVDPSIPTNLGGGTNEDTIIVLRASDAYLFEDGEPNDATYFEVLSGSLGVRFQVYGYFAFSAARYPKSIATIGGTGLVTPTF